MARKYDTREEWLQAAIEKLRHYFKEAHPAHPLPKEVRVSCGLYGRGRKQLGEAWSPRNSTDKHHEIFITPKLDDPFRVLATLTHELVHVAVGIKAGHKGHFIECARDVGLIGPWTATSASDALLDTLKGMTKNLGKYPHAALSGMTDGKKKQGTRLIKVGCPHCQYTVRMTMTWIIVGVPVCPNPDCDHQGEPFEVDGLERPDDEEEEHRVNP